MNSGNVLLITVGVVLAAMFFMVTDATSPKPASRAVQSTLLRSAIASGQPVLLEFYADWCGPCRDIGPVVDELARELQGKARVLRINVDEHSDLVREYGVGPLPVFITLKNGKEASRQVGVIDKASMRSMLGV